MSASDRIGIWVETGGHLNTNRQLFRFGKRVESVCIKNSTASAVVVDVAVARDPVFYIPLGHSGSHGNRREIVQDTYFYMHVAAGQTLFSPPFFAERGLKLKRVGGGTGVYGNACVYGVQPGDCITKGQL